jgi:putative colanic acid biosynthesis acetyltransferase WcaF
MRAPLKPNSVRSGNRIARAAWTLVWAFLYRPSPVPLHGWRRALLRLFGARIGAGAHPYPSARIWAPWNLTMGAHSCLGAFVDCYSVDHVELGAHATVSQYCFLCTASRDIEERNHPLVTAPLTIGAGAWVAADVFIGPGVSVGEWAVVGARSTVLHDVPPATLVAGNPAQVLRAAP